MRLLDEYRRKSSADKFMLWFAFTIWALAGYVVCIVAELVIKLTH